MATGPTGTSGIGSGLNRETKKFERKEKWHRLGDCDRTSKRQAERLRDQVVAAVNEQVFTMQNQILLTDFSAIYEGRHVPTLAFGNKYTSILKNHIVPAFGHESAHPAWPTSLI
jgi:hypothetical protein